MKTSQLSLVGLAWIASVVLVSAQKVHPALLRNHPAIAYATAPVSDPVAQLNERLKRGDVKLEKSDHSGYLPSVLSALGVSTDSQVLVFSKTSFQAPRITPTNPRAIFFNAPSPWVGSVAGRSWNWSRRIRNRDRSSTRSSSHRPDHRTSSATTLA